MRMNKMIIYGDLFQIVKVSPGTHLVKSHESQSRTNESQFKKTEAEIENAWVFM